jgi:threonylcarbamoyladenosine tRNA methylthiotransferase MtaB
LKVNLQTIGCRLNFSEIDAYTRDLTARGHTIVSDPDQADLVLVNTCTVTAKAASDSRQKVRQAARAGAEQIIVTGCWSTLEPGQAADLPGVSKVIANQDKDQLLPLLEREHPALFDLEPIECHPLKGMRLRTRAFIKVQDGCDNRCAFCITTLARGASRSRTVDEIIAEIRQLQYAGVKEYVLTGVNLGSWGQDWYQASNLRHLITQILDQTDPARLRLSSVEPWDIQPDFFDLWQDSRLCRHIHLPIQSGSDTILRRMARKGTTASYLKLIDRARKAIPDVSISTDLIVGFPGESDTEFDQSIDFVRRVGFSDAHVFSFSARPGTAAARMMDQVPSRTIRKRSQAMREVVSASKQAYMENFLQREVTVLWEARPELNGDEWLLSGLTDHHIRVKALSKEQIWNEFSLVRITETDDHFLRGEITLSRITHELH